MDSNGAFGIPNGRFPPKGLIRIDPYVRSGDPASGLLPLVSAGRLDAEGSPHPTIQAYDFRLCLARDNPISLAAPADYDPGRYELVRRYIAALETAGDPLWAGDLYWDFGHAMRHPHPRLLKITRLVRGGEVVNEGGFFHNLPKAYPIPYGVIVPREEDCENLLVTFCVSSTHAAFASFRMEPAFMILSESAGIAADQALREGGAVQRIAVAKLRERLLAAGQIL